MLRHKFLLFLGSLVALFVVGAVVAIWMLEGVLVQLDHVSDEAMDSIDAVGDLGSAITKTEAELYELQLGNKRHLDELIGAVDVFEDAMKRLERRNSILEVEGENALIFTRIKEQFPIFKQQIAAVVTTPDPGLNSLHYERALGLSIDLRDKVIELNRLARAHLAEEQNEAVADFRRVVIGLTIAALIAINITIAVLLRMTGMVLKPVEQLVRASRELGLEHFDHRVEVNQKDEFDELALAYNRLAEQLEANEERKMETLRHVALALNHELNNAILIIEMQLQLLRRRAGDDRSLEKPLHEIREGLARMTRTVGQLRNVRRIVLTDYVPGEKMLDLEQSASEEEPPPTVVVERAPSCRKSPSN